MRALGYELGTWSFLLFATSKKCRSRAVSYPAWRARRTDLSPFHEVLFPNLFPNLAPSGPLGSRLILFESHDPHPACVPKQKALAGPRMSLNFSSVTQS